MHTITAPTNLRSATAFRRLPTARRFPHLPCVRASVAGTTSLADQQPIAGEKPTTPLWLVKTCVVVGVVALVTQHNVVIHNWATDAFSASKLTAGDVVALVSFGFAVFTSVEQWLASHWSRLLLRLSHLDSIPGIKNDVAALKSDVSVLKEDVAVLKTDVTVVKEDVAVLKTDVTVVKAKVWWLPPYT
jgi:hypothetical protein